MEIILASGDRTVTRLLSPSLRACGGRVRIVNQAARLEAALEGREVGIAVLDVSLPGLDLHAAIRAARACESRSYVYLLLVAPREERSRLVALLRETGADALLLTPLDREDIRAKLDIAMRLLGAQEQLRLRAEDIQELTDKLQEQNQQLALTMSVLEAANRRFGELFQGLPVACYTYDREGRIHEWNRAAEALYGYRADQVFEKILWDTIVRRKDAARARERVARVFAGESVEGVEVTERRADGKPVHVLLNTFPLPGPDGSVVGAISAQVDISDRKQAEAELRDERDFTSAVLDTAGALVVVLDSQGRVVRFNRACQETTGFTFREMRGVRVWERLQPESEWPAAQERFRAASARSAPVRYESSILAHGGETRTVEWSTTVLQDARGKVKYIIGTGIDITDRKRAERQVEEQMNRIEHYSAELEVRKMELEETNTRLAALATTDGLTSVSNHRAFHEFLEREFKRARSTGQPLSLLVMDVDEFKRYNDTFGHPAGDEVLQRVAQLLSGAARNMDQVARHGGEEFAIVLPFTDLQRARLVGERVRARIAEEAWPLRPVTVSVGVATVQPWMQSDAELLSDADTALYAAKRSGRNCVRVFKPLPVAA